MAGIRGLSTFCSGRCVIFPTPFGSGLTREKRVAILVWSEKTPGKLRYWKQDQKGVVEEVWAGPQLWPFSLHRTWWQSQETYLQTKVGFFSPRHLPQSSLCANPWQLCAWVKAFIQVKLGLWLQLSSFYAQLELARSVPTFLDMAIPIVWLFPWHNITGLTPVAPTSFIESYGEC